MTRGPGRRRVLLLFAVLAGLFLMHGLSAPSMHCMPMPMPMSSHAESAMPATMPSHADMLAHADMPAQADMATTVGDQQPTADHMQSGETCVPLRPEGLTGLFLALFLVVIALWRPGQPYVPHLIHPRWPHGPPRAGVDLLRTLSISRT